jgi:hypothetical protein
VIDDLRGRFPHYGGDFEQGLNLPSLAATVLLFFACLAAAVTFGSVMQVETGGAVGPVEMLLATALCGAAYALVAGQPLIPVCGHLTSSDVRSLQQLGLLFLASSLCWFVGSSAREVWRVEDGVGGLGVLGCALASWAARRERPSASIEALAKRSEASSLSPSASEPTQASDPTDRSAPAE